MEVGVSGRVDCVLVADSLFEISSNGVFDAAEFGDVRVPPWSCAI